MFFDRLGVTSYGQQILNDLTYIGILKLNKTTVTGKLIVTGQFECSGATLHQVEVTGSCEFSDTIINGHAKLCGLLKAQRTRFNNDMYLYANVELTDSTTKNIIFEKDKSNSVQTLKIVNTTIDGNVIFKQGNGKIVLDPASRILGSTTGATVYQNPNPSP